MGMMISQVRTEGLGFKLGGLESRDFELCVAECWELVVTLWYVLAGLKTKVGYRQKSAAEAVEIQHYVRLAPKTRNPSHHLLKP